MLYIAISALTLLLLLTSAVLFPVGLTVSLCIRNSCAYGKIRLSLLFGLIRFSIRQEIFPAYGGGLYFCGPGGKNFGRPVAEELAKAQNKSSPRRVRSLIKSAKGPLIAALGIKKIELRLSPGGASAPDRAVMICGVLQIVLREVSMLFPHVRTSVSVMPSFKQGGAALDLQCIAVFRTGKFIIGAIINILKRSKEK